MNKKSSLIIAVIIGTAIAGVTGTIVAVQVGSKNPNCLSLEEARTLATFGFKVPSGLPAGYEFKCASGASSEMWLVFGPGNTPISNVHADDALAKGVVRLYIYDEAQILGPSEFAKKDTEAELRGVIEHTKQVNPAINNHVEYINGRLTLIREGCDNCGINIADFGNGNIIKKTDRVTSTLEFYDGSVVYSMETFLPSEVLVKVAQSIP